MIPCRDCIWGPVGHNQIQHKVKHRLQVATGLKAIIKKICKLQYQQNIQMK
jgi:hypothetical protein